MEECKEQTLTDLPSLVFRKVTGQAGFVTDELHLETRGYTMEEAKEAMTFLLKKHKEVDKDSNNQHKRKDL